MDVTCSVLTGSRSIFESVRFNIEHFPEKNLSQRGEIHVAETAESSSKRLRVEEVNRDVELEALSVILKLWLRRFHLTAEEGRRGLQNFEAEIKKTLMYVIEPFKAILRSRESKNQKSC